MKESNNVIERLNNKNLEKLSRKEAIELLQHIRKQFKTRYKYLIGEWQGAHRAKSTRDGKFVSKDEVVEYLDNVNRE